MMNNNAFIKEDEAENLVERNEIQEPSLSQLEEKNARTLEPKSNEQAVQKERDLSDYSNYQRAIDTLSARPEQSDEDKKMIALFEQGIAIKKQAKAMSHVNNIENKTRPLIEKAEMGEELTDLEIAAAYSVYFNMANMPMGENTDVFNMAYEAFGTHDLRKTFAKTIAPALKSLWTDTDEMYKYANMSQEQLRREFEDGLELSDEAKEYEQQNTLRAMSEAATGMPSNYASYDVRKAQEKRKYTEDEFIQWTRQKTLGVTREAMETCMAIDGTGKSLTQAQLLVHTAQLDDKELLERIIHSIIEQNSSTDEEGNLKIDSEMLSLVASTAYGINPEAMGGVWSFIGDVITSFAGGAWDGIKSAFKFAGTTAEYIYGSVDDGDVAKYVDQLGGLDDVLKDKEKLEKVKDKFFVHELAIGTGITYSKDNPLENVLSYVYKQGANYNNRLNATNALITVSTPKYADYGIVGNAVVDGVGVLGRMSPAIAATILSGGTAASVFSTAYIYADQSQCLIEGLENTGFTKDEAYIYGVLGGILLTAIEKMQIKGITKIENSASILYRYFKGNTKLKEIARDSVIKALRKRGKITIEELSEEAMQNFATELTMQIGDEIGGRDLKTLEESIADFNEATKDMIGAVIFATNFGGGIRDTYTSTRDIATIRDAKDLGTISQLNLMRKKTSQVINKALSEQNIPLSTAESYIRATTPEQKDKIVKDIAKASNLNPEAVRDTLNEVEKLSIEDFERSVEELDKATKSINKSIDAATLGEFNPKTGKYDRTPEQEEEFRKQSNAIINSYIKAHGGEDNVVFVENFANLDSQIKEALFRQSLAEGVPISRYERGLVGFHSAATDKVYIIGDKTANPQAVLETLKHERVHWAAKDIRKSIEFSKLMNKLVDTYGGVELMKEVFRRQGILDVYWNKSISEEQNKVALAEEFIARIAEKVAGRNELDAKEKSLWEKTKKFFVKTFSEIPDKNQDIWVANLIRNIWDREWRNTPNWEQAFTRDYIEGENVAADLNKDIMLSFVDDEGKSSLIGFDDNYIQDDNLDLDKKVKIVKFNKDNESNIDISLSETDIGKVARDIKGIKGSDVNLDTGLILDISSSTIGKTLHPRKGESPFVAEARKASVAYLNEFRKYAVRTGVLEKSRGEKEDPNLDEIITLHIPFEYKGVVFRVRLLAKTLKVETKRHKNRVHTSRITDVILENKEEDSASLGEGHAINAQASSPQNPLNEIKVAQLVFESQAKSANNIKQSYNPHYETAMMAGLTSFIANLMYKENGKYSKEKIYDTIAEKAPFLIPEEFDLIYNDAVEISSKALAKDNSTIEDIKDEAKKLAASKALAKQRKNAVSIGQRIETLNNLLNQNLEKYTSATLDLANAINQEKIREWGIDLQETVISSIEQGFDKAQLSQAIDDIYTIVQDWAKENNISEKSKEFRQKLVATLQAELTTALEEFEYGKYRESAFNALDNLAKAQSVEKVLKDSKKIIEKMSLRLEKQLNDINKKEAKAFDKKLKQKTALRKKDFEYAKETGRLKDKLRDFKLKLQKERVLNDILRRLSSYKFNPAKQTEITRKVEAQRERLLAFIKKAIMLSEDKMAEAFERLRWAGATKDATLIEELDARLERFALAHFGNAKDFSLGGLIRARDVLIGLIEISKLEMFEKKEAFEEKTLKKANILTRALNASKRKKGNKTKSWLLEELGGVSMLEHKLWNTFTGYLQGNEEAEVKGVVKSIAKDMMDASLEERRLNYLWEIELQDLIKEVYGNETDGVKHLTKNREELRKFSSGSLDINLDIVVNMVAAFEQASVRASVNRIRLVGLDKIKGEERRANATKLLAQYEKVAEMRQALSGKELRLLEGLKALYRKRKARIEPSIVSVMGMPILDSERNYMPVARDVRSNGVTVDGVSLIPARYAPRTVNYNPIDENVGVISAFLESSRQDSHFVAFSQKASEIMAIFNSRELADAMDTHVEGNSRASILNFLKKSLNNTDGQKKDPDNKATLLNTGASVFAVLKLGWNFVSALKQTSSVLSGALEQGMIRTSKDVAWAITTQEGHDALMTVLSSDYMKSRGATGLNPAMVIAMNEFNKGKFDKGWFKKFMAKVKPFILTTKMDAFVSAIATAGIYKRAYDEAIINNSEEVAKDLALKAAMGVVEMTQQSSMVMNMSNMERAGTLGKLFMQLRKYPQQMLSYEMRLFRDFAKDTSKENFTKLASAVFLNHILSPALFNGIGLLLSIGLFGDDPDELDWELIAYSGLVDVLGGFYLGAVASGIGGLCIGLGGSNDMASKVAPSFSLFRFSRHIGNLFSDKKELSETLDDMAREISLYNYGKKTAENLF